MEYWNNGILQEQITKNQETPPGPPLGRMEYWKNGILKEQLTNNQKPLLGTMQYRKKQGLSNIPRFHHSNIPNLHWLFPVLRLNWNYLPNLLLFAFFEAILSGWSIRSLPWNESGRWPRIDPRQSVRPFWNFHRMNVAHHTSPAQHSTGLDIPWCSAGSTLLRYFD